MDKPKSFIKLDRSILEWESFKDGRTLQVWIYLLCSARFKAATVNGISVRRGEVLASKGEIARSCGMTDRQARACIDRLIASGEIKRRENLGTKAFSVFKIVKYNEYQDAMPTKRPTIRPTQTLAAQAFEPF
jgi:hypothetical protein